MKLVKLQFLPVSLFFSVFSLKFSPPGSGSTTLFYSFSQRSLVVSREKKREENPGEACRWLRFHVNNLWLKYTVSQAGLWCTCTACTVSCIKKQCLKHNALWRITSKKNFIFDGVICLIILSVVILARRGYTHKKTGKNISIQIRLYREHDSGCEAGGEFLAEVHI